MTTIEQLEDRLNNLEQTVLQMARNNVPVVGKVDDTSNKVTDLTPYTETKTAYIGDTEVVFTDVPNGNLMIYSPIPVTYSHLGDKVVVGFDEPLEEVTTITISVVQ